MTAADIDLSGIEQLPEFANRGSRRVQFGETHPTLMGQAGCDVTLATKATSVHEARALLVVLLRDVADRVERSLVDEATS